MEKKWVASSFAWETCSGEKKACVGWVSKYFGDCVCDPSSEISFALGLVGLFSWGVAEIPQIITNFHTKSGHGVSLGLLLTWILGDIFNLVGCVLEPATLPTQLYTAVLYTATTVVLVLQTFYYDYLLEWTKSRCFDAKQEFQADEEKQLLEPKRDDRSNPISATTSRRASPRIDAYYTSARSLARSGSYTPSHGSPYLGSGRSGPSSHPLRYHEDDGSSSDEEVPRDQHQKHETTKTITRSVAYGTLISALANLPFQSHALMEMHIGFMGQKFGEETGDGNTYGLLLGWIMAAIYMGGRLPQIYLNIKRGSVEGLNPLMFMFALIANATYVGSILVRSVEWERLKANAPWLLDAIVCVLLDLLIMLQFAYYKHINRRKIINQEDNVCYEKVKEPLV
ncbi:vacuolar lysine transporter YPQ1 [Typha latifolia]|uniref:vacuolar lysine transporter YPQ1 n=1 Tax=Typha latifolia TaxID=4733 RepID=UPI003C30225F